MDQQQFEDLVLYATDHLWHVTMTYDGDYNDPIFRFAACENLLLLLGVHRAYASDLYAWSAAIRDIERAAVQHDEECEIEQMHIERYEQYALIMADPVMGPFHVSKVLDSTREPHRRYEPVLADLWYDADKPIIFPTFTTIGLMVPTLAAAKELLRNEGDNGYRYIVHRDKLDSDYFWSHTVQPDPQEIVATFTILNGEPHRVETPARY